MLKRLLALFQVVDLPRSIPIHYTIVSDWISHVDTYVSTYKTHVAHASRID